MHKAAAVAHNLMHGAAFCAAAEASAAIIAAAG
jgi:hypothetical protein